MAGIVPFQLSITSLAAQANNGNNALSMAVANSNLALVRLAIVIVISFPR